MSTKFYRYGIEIPIQLCLPFPEFIPWCKSPIYQMVPGCLKCFYECEMEEQYGTIKHLPGMHKYVAPKDGTSVNCRQMPKRFCQNLIDKRTMYCYHCGNKMEV